MVDLIVSVDGWTWWSWESFSTQIILWFWVHFIGSALLGTLASEGFYFHEQPALSDPAWRNYYHYHHLTRNTVCTRLAVLYGEFKSWASLTVETAFPRLYCEWPHSDKTIIKGEGLFCLHINYFFSSSVRLRASIHISLIVITDVQLSIITSTDLISSETKVRGFIATCSFFKVLVVPRLSILSAD